MEKLKRAPQAVVSLNRKVGLISGGFLSSVRMLRAQGMSVFNIRDCASTKQTTLTVKRRRLATHLLRTEHERMPYLSTKFELIKTRSKV